MKSDRSVKMAEASKYRTDKTYKFYDKSYSDVDSDFQMSCYDIVGNHSRFQ